ncbi:hypothetical protein ABGB18_32560 [Nonomuraea sp. B12E4]|uniref:hypothetical protein n=1 Tax=Nonomuraea sp. B12E4 TaxID=3153564 RepID=UPI00325E22CF
MPFEGRAGRPLESDGQFMARQLDVLRTTYPGWEIHLGADGPGAARWTAELRRPVTAQMLAAGMRERLVSHDAVTLASALAHQACLLHRRSSHWPG